MKLIVKKITVNNDFRSLNNYFVCERKDNDIIVTGPAKAEVKDMMIRGIPDELGRNILKPTDGDDFIRALARQYENGYFYIEFVEFA